MDAREDRDNLMAIILTLFGAAVLILAVLFYVNKRDADLRVATACERMADSLEFRRAGKPPPVGNLSPRRHTPTARPPLPHEADTGRLDEKGRKAARPTSNDIATAINAITTCNAGVCR